MFLKNTYKEYFYFNSVKKEIDGKIDNFPKVDFFFLTVVFAKKTVKNDINGKERGEGFFNIPPSSSITPTYKPIRRSIKN